ncbi:MAG: hypothetical protein IJW60_06200 [Clostridia bacterium]|nr:hypothetical protein [Clostridia bacterium]
MLFRNSIRLLTENFKNVYKILLYQFIVGLVAGALCVAMILPELTELVNSAPVQDLLTELKAFFTALFAADAEQLELVKENIFGDSGAFRRLSDLLLSKTAGIVLAAVGCLIVYLLKRFADTLCFFAVGGVMNDKMSSYTETPFAASYVKNIGKACRYALVYVPIAFAFDVATLGIAFLVFRLFGILTALSFSMTVIVLVQALKLTLTSRWMPSMITDGTRLRNSLRSEDKTEKKQRAKMFSTYLVSVYGVVIINVIAAICTFGSALILTVPASYFLFICEHFVHYYTVKGKKYFITFERIASNPDRGDREHFFDYIEDTNEK